jgi:hypothetical protein
LQDNTENLKKKVSPSERIGTSQKIPQTKITDQKSNLSNIIASISPSQEPDKF